MKNTIQYERDYVAFAAKLNDKTVIRFSEIDDGKFVKRIGDNFVGVEGTGGESVAEHELEFNHLHYDTAYGWGDHAGLYTPLAHKTVEDAINGLVKVNGAGTYSAVVDNSTNWNTAYGWGDHAGLYSLLGHSHTGLISGLTTNYIPKASSATGLTDSLLSETTDDVVIPTAKSFGLGAGKGRLTFTDTTVDTIVFNDCYVGIGKIPKTLFHLYENNASEVPQLQIEQDDIGDAALRFLLTSGQAYTIGIDNSVAGDILKISPTTTLGATLPFCMNASGEIGINIAPLALHNMRISNATTDASGGNVYATMSGTANNNGTYSNSVFALDVGQYGAANNTGSIIGFQMSSYHYGAGNLSLLSGGYYFYGNHNDSGATSEAIGQYIGLVKRSGNITTCYDLYLAPALVTSGTATNEWAICSDHVAPSKFVHDVRFATDTYGTVYGAGNDVRILYDGANTVLRTLVGSANYILDGYTTVDTDCSLTIGAGTTKDAILTFTCDEHDQACDGWRLRTVYNATSSNNLFKLQCDNAVKGTFVDLMIVTTAGILNLTNTPNYANDAAAKAGGLVNGDVYRNGDVLMVCHA